MALKTFVKVSGVNNLSDARYCAGMGVDVIGFNIDPTTENAIDPEKYKEISSWVAGVDFAGESDALSSALVSTYDVQYVETTQASQLSLIGEDYKKILRVNLGNIQDIEGDQDLILVDGPQQLAAAEVEVIQNLSKNHKVLLACGFDHNNVEELIAQTGVHGIAINAGDEIRPGYKDYDEIADILEALEIDD